MSIYSLTSEQRKELCEVPRVERARLLYSELWSENHPCAEVVNGLFVQLATEAAEEKGFFRPERQ